jgi:hypothetical protein
VYCANTGHDGEGGVRQFAGIVWYGSEDTRHVAARDQQTITDTEASDLQPDMP